jgi:DNA-binding NarL/FixJ family response regulator
MSVGPHLVPDDVKITELTERQQEVAGLACQGLSNRIIADKLGLTEGTVKCHLNAIYEKLDVHSRANLLARFWRVLENS